MMSKKQWLALLCVHMCYILFGASVLYVLESAEEAEKIYGEEQNRRIIEELIKENYVPNLQREFFLKLSAYCDKPLGENKFVHDPNAETKITWSFYNSVFFIMTILSTIGYGNLSPSTPFTRAFVIIFGTIGIPINGIVILTLGNFFGKTFFKIYDRWKTSSVEHAVKTIGFIGQITLYVLTGLVLLVLMPSLVIMWYEQWTFDLAIEFGFATLTTVGIGTHVPGTTDNGTGQISLVFYRIFLIAWLIVGLGYLAMVFQFITRGLSSKQFRNIEQRLAQNIRKIHQELRFILNEYLMTKAKPTTYRKRRANIIPSFPGRTQSCPDLSVCRLNTQVKSRAISLLTRPSISLPKKQADSNQSDKTSIDKSDSNILLLKVMDALSYYDKEEYLINGVGIRPRTVSEYKIENEIAGYQRAQPLREEERYGRTRRRTLPSVPGGKNYFSQIKSRNDENYKCKTFSKDFFGGLKIGGAKKKARRCAIPPPSPTRKHSLILSVSKNKMPRRFSICPLVISATQRKKEESPNDCYFQYCLT